MTEENKKKLKAFFVENIGKMLAGFADSSDGTIRIRFCYHPYDTGMEVSIGHGDYFSDKACTFLEDKGACEKDTMKSIGDVLVDASARFTEFPRTLSHEKRENYKRLEDYPYWKIESYQYVDAVIFENHPCKEFNDLNSYLSEHYRMSLGDHDLYRIALFGKRGRYSETGDKHYLCHYPTACRDILKQLERQEPKSIGFCFDDDIDTNNSIRYETECYGCRTKCLKADGRLVWW